MEWKDMSDRAHSLPIIMTSLLDHSNCFPKGLLPILKTTAPFTPSWVCTHTHIHTHTLSSRHRTHLAFQWQTLHILFPPFYLLMNLFLFLWPWLWCMEVPRPGVQLELLWLQHRHGNSRSERVASSSCAAACDSARSLTHWARPGIQPASS